MNRLEVISEKNLSVAWSKAFMGLLDSGHNQVSPLVVKVSGFGDGLIPEDVEIRQCLDDCLRTAGLQSVHTVANTIFPRSMWNPDLGPAVLYERYKKNWSRIKKDALNRNGHYFQRLIEYENGTDPVNQLSHIINTWNLSNHRHSALQASIFDPRKDHSNSRRRGFPCLQQIAFSPIGPNGIDGLAIIGFYATQHLFEKAYGNYLGLFRLGHFMAKEMRLRLAEMTCIASYAKIGNISKSHLSDLRSALSGRLATLENGGTNE